MYLSAELWEFVQSIRKSETKITQTPESFMLFNDRDKINARAIPNEMSRTVSISIFMDYTDIYDIEQSVDYFRNDCELFRALIFMSPSHQEEMLKILKEFDKNGYSMNIDNGCIYVWAASSIIDDNHCMTIDFDVNYDEFTVTAERLKDMYVKKDGLEKFKTLRSTPIPDDIVSDVYDEYMAFVNSVIDIVSSNIDSGSAVTEDTNDSGEIYVKFSDKSEYVFYLPLWNNVIAASNDIFKFLDFMVPWIEKRDYDDNTSEMVIKFSDYAEFAITDFYLATAMNKGYITIKNEHMGMNDASSFLIHIGNIVNMFTYLFARTIEEQKKLSGIIKDLSKDFIAIITRIRKDSSIVTIIRFASRNMKPSFVFEMNLDLSIDGMYNSIFSMEENGLLNEEQAKIIKDIFEKHMH